MVLALEGLRYIGQIVSPSVLSAIHKHMHRTSSSSGFITNAALAVLLKGARLACGSSSVLQSGACLRTALSAHTSLVRRDRISALEPRVEPRVCAVQHCTAVKPSVCASYNSSANVLARNQPETSDANGTWLHQPTTPNEQPSAQLRSRSRPLFRCDGFMRRLHGTASGGDRLDDMRRQVVLASSPHVALIKRPASQSGGLI